MALEINQNRLRFVHCENVFADASEVRTYIDKSRVDRPYLFAEPCVYLYGDAEDPKVILTIGSVGDGTFQTNEQGEMINRIFIIDFAQVEQDIEAIKKELEDDKKAIEDLQELVKNIIAACGFDENGNYVPSTENPILKDATSLFDADKILSEYIIALESKTTLIGVETSTVKPTIEISENGTTISADVKRGTKIYNGKVINNIIAERNDGLFVNVDMDYSEKDSQITLTVNGGDESDNGFVKTLDIPQEVHLIGGHYDKYKEQIVLELNAETTLKDGSIGKEICFDVKELIDEIVVIGEESETPIVLTKVPIKTGQHGHDDVDEYVHAIGGDIRIYDNPLNILRRTENGKALYVEGTAVNIRYGNKTVKGALDEMSKYTKIALDNDNIIKLNADGLFADVKLDYNTATNELIFEASNGTKETFKLNAAQFIDSVTYDAKAKVLHIKYIDVEQKVQDVAIPLEGLLETWVVDNVNSTVTLEKDNDPSGIIKLKGNVNVAKLDDNILSIVSANTSSSHLLYVKGTADNIKLDNELFAATNVDSALSELSRAKDNAVQAEKERAENAEALLDAKIESEAKRAKNAEEELDEKIDEAKVSLTKHFIDTNSVDFTVTPREDGSEEVSATIKIDDYKDNLLEGGDKPLKVTAKLDFNQVTRELTLIGSNDFTSTVTLPDLKVIEKIRYDATTKSLVITYVNSEGKHEEVEVPIGDLFNEWDVYNAEDSVVFLTRTSATTVGDKDMLSADVKVSTLSTNLLVKNRGNLYVSNAASSIILANGTNVEDAISGLSSKDSELEQSIKDEVTRATAKENEIASNLENEITRATLAEGDLKTKIETETTRAQGVENELKTKLDTVEGNLANEVTRAKEKESSLDAAITNEVTRATNEEDKIAHNLSNEVTRATLAEGNLENKINDEVTRAKDAENAVSNKLDTVEGNLADEVARAKETESNLNTAITNEITRSTERDEAIQNQVTQNANAISNVTTKIDEEITRATAKENELSESILTNTSELKQAVSALTHSLEDETNERTRIDGELQGQVNVIDSKIDEIDDKIAEISSDTAITFSSTATLDLTKDENKIVKGNVNVSKTDKNIINTQVDGIYATVDLSYEPTTNELTFTTSTSSVPTSKVITMQSVSVIQDIIYLEDSNELQIIYKNEEGVTKETKISADNFFKPISADTLNKNIDLVVNEGKNYVISANLDVNKIIENTDDCTVKLEKNDNNKIIAKVKVSDRNDNALKVDASNLLYVSNNANDIKLTGTTVALGDNVDEALNTLNDKIKDANDKITTVKGIDFADNVLTLTYEDAEGDSHEISCEMNLDITDKITTKSDVEHNVNLEITKDENTQTTLIIGDVNRFDCGEY